MMFWFIVVDWVKAVGLKEQLIFPNLGWQTLSERERMSSHSHRRDFICCRTQMGQWIYWLSNSPRLAISVPVAAPCTRLPCSGLGTAGLSFSATFLWAEVIQTQLRPSARVWSCSTLAHLKWWGGEFWVRAASAGIASKGKGVGHRGPRALKHRLVRGGRSNFLHFRASLTCLYLATRAMFLGLDNSFWWIILGDSSVVLTFICC